MPMIIDIGSLKANDKIDIRFSLCLALILTYFIKNANYYRRSLLFNW